MSFEKLNIVPLLFYIGILCLVSLIFACYAKRVKSVANKRTYTLFSIAALWFAVSVSMTMFNKYLFSFANGHGFRYPFLVTSAQMLIKLILSTFTTSVCSQDNNQNLSNYLIIRQTIPVGICTVIDIALSSLGLEYVTASTYTILRSGGIIWVLAISVLMGLQEFHWSLLLIILFICTGIMLSSYGGITFHMFGSVVVIGSTIAMALRWCLTQYLLQGQYKLSPILTLKYTAFSGLIFFLPISIYYEGNQFVERELKKLSSLSQPPFEWNEFNPEDVGNLLLPFIFVLIVGVFAFLLLNLEYHFVQKSSSLTLTVVGHFKDILQILLSVLIFNDTLSIINYIGITIAFGSIISYRLVSSSLSIKKKIEQISQHTLGYLPLSVRTPREIGATPRDNRESLRVL